MEESAKLLSPRARFSPGSPREEPLVSSSPNTLSSELPASVKILPEHQQTQEAKRHISAKQGESDDSDGESESSGEADCEDEKDENTAARNAPKKDTRELLKKFKIDLSLVTQLHQDFPPDVAQQNQHHSAQVKNYKGSIYDAQR